MTHRIPFFVASVSAAAILASVVPVCRAGAPVEPVPLPEAFGVIPTQVMQGVIYSESAGEAPNTVDRAAVENVCTMRRSIDAATPTPIFEAGFDRPDTTKSVRFVAPQASADYLTVVGYACDPATAGPTHDLCGCTFREHTSRFVHIRRRVADGTEFIDADLARGTLTRDTRHGASSARAMAAQAHDAASLGPVVGSDTVAGIACKVHRQDVGAGRLERCIVDASDATAPTLSGQQLANARYLLRGGQMLRLEWSRTGRIVPDAVVDTGVFDAPAGLHGKTPHIVKEAP